MSQWISNLDACAAAGILNYDAPADILGTDPRYAGHPDFATTLLPPGTKMKEAPKNDEFNDSNIVKNPSWKKWTFGAIAAGLIGWGIYALTKGKVKAPKFTKKFKLPSMSKIGTSLKNFGISAWNTIKKPFVWVASKFKK